MTPVQSVEGSAGEGDPERRVVALDGALLDELWLESEAESCGLDRGELERILLAVGGAQNFGVGEGAVASKQEQAAYFRGLKLSDVVLARACAAGKERAWERFVAMYRESLTRAAISITRSETLGQELADQLYGELYGLTMRDGERRCPLESYRGRGSLMGWLRTTLAQRHVDHYRRRYREEPLEEWDAPAEAAVVEKTAAELTVLETAVEAALKSCAAEDRLLLAAYYLDGRTLLQIAQVMRVHESTVSRKLKRACEEIRKQVIKHLQIWGHEQAGGGRGAGG